MRVMEEEQQALKVHHAEELSACLDASPIDLAHPDRPRKARTTLIVLATFTFTFTPHPNIVALY